MSLKDIRARHLTLIAVYSMKHALRGGSGLVYLLVLLLFGLSVGSIVMMPIELAQKEAKKQGVDQTDEQVLDGLVDMGKPMLVRFIGDFSDVPEGETAEEKEVRENKGKEAERRVNYLVSEKPALLSVILFILMFGQPFIVTFSGFNLVSSDVRSRGIRYQLIRTERINIFLGRYIGTLLFATISLAVVIGTISLYLGLKLRIYPTGDLILWSLQGFLALALVTPPYLALCSWVSALIDSPFASLVVSKLMIGGVPLIAFIGKKSWEPLELVKYVLPWGVQTNFFHPDISLTVIATLACFGYTAFFLFLGVRHFNRCDL